MRLSFSFSVASDLFSVRDVARSVAPASPNRFPLKFKFEIDDVIRLPGISPEIKFPSRLSVASTDILPNEGGIGPVILFIESSRSANR